MTAAAEAPAAPEPVAAGAPTSQEEALERATQWANDQTTRLTERVQNYLAKANGQSNGGLAPRIGEPTTYTPTGVPYVAFDVAATSPIQFIGLPPYLPSKIIKVGEAAFLVAYIYTNNKVDVAAGWAIPANIVLGLRQWRMTLDQSNLTTGGNLPSLVRVGVFPPVPPPVTPVVFPLPIANLPLGTDPWLIEANVTVYVDVPAQPFAAFATNFFDEDNDPGFPPFPFLPPIPSVTRGWRHDQPNRYLIYP